MLLKPLIFSLFGDFEKIIDSKKDVADKGILERVQESVGEDYDEELADLIDNFVTYNVPPTTASESVLPNIEADYGNVGILPAMSLPNRRTAQRHILKYYAIRGTKKCYELMLNLIGFDAEITEFFSTFTFDSPVTLDDPERVFDLGKCSACSGYTINLIRFSGSDPLSDAELAVITRIIKFNEPINARLVSLTLDGSTVGDFNIDYNYDFLS